MTKFLLVPACCSELILLQICFIYAVSFFCPSRCQTRLHPAVEMCHFMTILVTTHSIPVQPEYRPYVGRHQPVTTGIFRKNPSLFFPSVVKKKERRSHRKEAPTGSYQSLVCVTLTATVASSNIHRVLGRVAPTVVLPYLTAPLDVSESSSMPKLPCPQGLGNVPSTPACGIIE